MEKLEIRAVIKYTSVRKTCLPHRFMKTSWNPLKESPSYSTIKKRAAKFKRGRQSNEDDGRSDAAADKNVKVVHILVNL